MTVKTIATLQTDIATAINDNTSGDVSPADVRTSIIDTIQSLIGDATYSFTTQASPTTITPPTAQAGTWRVIEGTTFEDIAGMTSHNYVEFRNCIFQDATTMTTCTHLRFVDCVWPLRTGTSAALALVSCEDVEVRNCVFEGSDRDGIRATTCTNVRITNPTILNACASAPTSQSYALNMRPVQVSIRSGTCVAENGHDAIITTGQQQLIDQDQVRFRSTGTLPSPLVADTLYYVKKLTKTFVPGDVDTGTETITITSHGLTTDDAVSFTTTTTLPAPLTAGTVYWVIGAAANTFQLSLTKGGSALNLTSTGSGTHTVKYSTYHWKVSTTPGGAAINLTTDGTGTHTWFTRYWVDRTDSHAAITFDTCTQFSVDGGTIKDSLQIGIYCDDCLHGKIRNVFLDRCGQYFDVDSSTFSHGIVDIYECTNVEVADCLIQRPRSFGIRIGGDADSGSISCKARDNLLQMWTSAPGALFDPSKTFTATGTTVTCTGHRFPDGCPVQLTTTGTLPTGFSLATTYYTRDAVYGSNTLSLAATSNGAAISVSGGSGTHTITTVQDAYDCDLIAIVESTGAIIEGNVTRWGGQTGISQDIAQRCLHPVIAFNHSYENGIHQDLNHADGILLASSEYGVILGNLMHDNPRTGLTVKSGGNTWGEYTIHDTRVIANTMYDNASDMTSAGYTNPSVSGNATYYTQTDFGADYAVAQSRLMLAGNSYARGYYFESYFGCEDTVAFGELYSDPVATAQYQIQTSDFTDRLQFFGQVMHGRDTQSGSANLLLDSTSNHIKLFGGIYMGIDPVNGDPSSSTVWERPRGMLAGDLSTISTSDQMDRMCEVHTIDVVFDGVYIPKIAATNQQADTYDTVTSVRVDTTEGWMRSHEPIRIQPPSSGNILFVGNGWGPLWLNGASNWPTAASTTDHIANANYQEGRELWAHFTEVGTTTKDPMFAYCIGGSAIDECAVSSDGTTTGGTTPAGTIRIEVNGTSYDVLRV